MPGCDISPHTHTFHWRIENFIVFLYGSKVSENDDRELRSPPFTFKTIRDTVWQLTVGRQHKRLLGDLKLVDDNGLDQIHFSYHLYLIKGRNKERCRMVSRSTTLILSETDIIEDIIDLETLEKEYVYEDGLTFLLEITLHQNMYPNPDSNKTEAVELSDALGRLRDRAPFSDLTLVSKDGYKIKCHKFMIATRWPDLHTENILEYPPKIYTQYSLPILQTILDYVYSGRVESSKLTSSFFAAVSTTKDMFVSPVLDHFRSFPVEVHSVTNIKVEILTLIFSLKDIVPGDESFKCIVQEIYVQDVHENFLVELQIYGSEEDKKRIKMNFRFPTLSKETFFKYSIAFATDDNDDVVSREASHSFTDNSLLTVMFTLDDNLFISTSMKLVCKLVFSDGTIISEEQTSKDYHLPSNAPAVADIQQLRKDIKNLYDDRVMGDVLIRCGAKLFRAHAAMLSIRSEKFEKSLRDAVRTSDYAFSVTDISEPILDILLSYIYGIELSEDLLKTNANALCQAADNYGLTGLLNMCRKFISSEQSE